MGDFGGGKGWFLGKVGAFNQGWFRFKRLALFWMVWLKVRLPQVKDVVLGGFFGGLEKRGLKGEVFYNRFGHWGDLLKFNLRSHRGWFAQMLGV